MCIATITFGHPQYEVIIASNRDEWFDRPTSELAWWDDQTTLGGRDLSAGGTWLAVNRRGRFGMVTNVRGVEAKHSTNTGTNSSIDSSINNRSRGELIPLWLNHHGDSISFFAQLLVSADHYAGFNFVFGEVMNDPNRSSRTYYFSNAALQVCHQLWPIDAAQCNDSAQTTYGLSNAQLDTPWPKVEKLKNLSRASLDAIPTGSAENLSNDLFKNLLDTEQFGGTALSAINVRANNFLHSGRNYGRRSSAVLLMTKNGEVFFSEQNPGHLGDDHHAINFKTIF